MRGVVCAGVCTGRSHPPRIRGEVSRRCAIQIDVYLTLPYLHQSLQLLVNSSSVSVLPIWKLVLKPEASGGGRTLSADEMMNVHRHTYERRIVSG